MEKRLKLFAYLLFAVLFILSAYFYQERIFFADSGYQFFKIINFEKFNLEASRYAALITQIPLLITIKLNLTGNVRILSVIYSISFILLYFSLFVLIDRGIKNTTAAIVLLSVLIIGISRSFFYTVTETHQALAYAVAFYAIYGYKFRNEALNYVLPFILMALSFYSHIVAIIVLPFILIFYHIHFKQAINLRLLFISSFLIILLLIKLFLVRPSSYEESFLSQVSDFGPVVASFWNLASIRFFNIHLPDIYMFQVLFLIYSIIYLARNKKYLELAFIIFSTLIVFTTLVITYNKHDSGMNMERAFMPLAVVICLPFFNYISENKKEKRLIVILVQAILVFSLVRITHNGYLFEQRTARIKNMIEYARDYSDEDKFIIRDKTIVGKFGLSPSAHYWSYSIETLMYSLTGDGRQITIYATDQEDLTGLTEQRDVFLATTFWMIWDEKSMNKKYYRLKSGTYQLLE